MGQWALLVEVSNAEAVPLIAAGLEKRGVPYRVGVLADRPPRAVFTVPEERLSEARELVATWRLVQGATAPDDAEPEGVAPPVTVQRLPALEIAALIGVALLHLLVVAYGMNSAETSYGLVQRFGLAGGAAFGEPWRLWTYALIHSGISHVFWNGAAMVVFGVPLLVGIGYRRTLLVYLAAAGGGGVASALLTDAGRWVIGSSGAVAGLFGAWILLAMRDARRLPLPRRATLRVLGIALVVLPSLLSPVTASGQPISVSGHVGGMLTGMAVGLALSGGLFLREPELEPITH